MLIDTHAHLNFAAYKEDFDKVIKRSIESKIWMINIGTNYQTSKRAVEIIKEYPKGVFATIGLHPINLDTGLIKLKKDESELSSNFRFEKDFDYKKYGELILEGGEKVIAVGEIGFDFWYRPKTKTKKEQFQEKQRELFRKEIALAKEFELPLILHCRLGYEDLVRELKKINYKFGGVLHCFCDTWERAKKILEMGYYIGFNGIIFKLDLDEAIKKTPLDKILIETDCPYLTPPLIGKYLNPRQSANKKTDQRKSTLIRNEPINVKYIAERIAKIKKVKIEEVEKITTKNALGLFRIS